ncbi:hypothetical protein K2P47_00090 [Patescibacteria group bacterium]|nr:hypothetical protein [Patescibacteria group bacterium]
MMTRAIDWGMAEPGHRWAKSYVKVALDGPPYRTSDNEVRLHPSVRFGGTRYPDNGHHTSFSVSPGRIELRDGLNYRHYTFQVT